MRLVLARRSRHRYLIESRGESAAGQAIDAAVIMGDRLNHRILNVGRGCSAGCRFCTHSNGRFGASPDELTSQVVGMEPCLSATIMAGDVISDAMVPAVTALRAAGTPEILLYAHPASDDLDAFKVLFDAGVTGLHLLVPAVDHRTLDLVCGPRASLKKLATVIRAANLLGMPIRLEVPVLFENFHSIPDIVARSLSMIRKPAGIEFPFRAVHDGRGTRGWDYRLAAGQVIEAVELATAAGVPVRTGGREGAPPCVLDIQCAFADLYPELDRLAGDIAARPFAQCASCDAAGACVADARGFKPEPDRPLEPVLRQDGCGPTAPSDKPENRSSPESSAALFIRRTDLNRLLVEASKAERCTAPWDSLEAHDRTGRVAPCEGSWPRRDVIGDVPDQGRGWMNDGLLRSFNSPAMVRMRRTMMAGGREASCNPHCPRFTESAGNHPQLRLPRTHVFHDNLIRNLTEFVDGADILESRPRNITISPSLRCNQRCIMCDLTDSIAGETGMNTPPAIIDELIELLPTTATLALTGGEPLTSSRIVKLVAGITDARLPDTSVTLTTNGTLLTPTVIETLKASRISKVYISLNASSQESHARVTGIEGRFQKVLNNITAMVAASAFMPLRPSVILSFVVMKSTLADLPDFIELARRHGAGIRLLPVERNRLGESIFTDPDTMLHAQKALMKLNRTYTDTWPEAAAETGRLVALLKKRIDSNELAPL